MYNRLIRYVDKFHLLTEVQHGFRKGKSTETASQSFIEYIQEALDNHCHVIGIFLDLTKAYDVVNHDILLNKLDLYGIRGVTKLWFKSCLSTHMQFVEINQVDK
jgi:retron-type reverse transcriptase